MARDVKHTLETPEEIRRHVWMELSRAVLDRHHAWRTPVLATVGGDGQPNARTVVLRRVDASLATLSFFADSRSEKMAELLTQPKAMLVFWSTRLNWQLRARVSIEMHTSGTAVEAVWERVKQSAAAGDYLSAQAPGQKLLADDVAGGAAKSDANVQHHLAVLTAQIEEMDWLELARGGHRRARFGAQAWAWLTP